MSAGPRDAGFTLVEVLVSMFIFSMISVGALIALSTTLDAREAATARIDRVERLAAAHRALADDFGAAILRPNRDGLGGMVDPSREILRNDQFILTRRGRLNPNGAFARGDLLRVSWRVENDQLIRAFLPHENPAFVAPPIDRVVLEGVEAMRVTQLIDDRSLDIILPIQAADAVSIQLTHSDGTTTLHVFEAPDG